MAVEAAPRGNVWKAIARIAWRALTTPRRIRPIVATVDRAAALRARELLFAHLTPAQHAELERRHGFTVRGSSGRCYRIGFGTVANIEVLDEAGGVEYRLCACPKQVPVWGVMLAQKLMLESREAEFLRVAVRHAANLALNPQRRTELNDVHVDRARAVVADHVQAHSPAGRRGQDAAVEGARRGDRLVVATDDEIAFAQPGPRRGSVRIERADAHAGLGRVDDRPDAARDDAAGVVPGRRAGARGKQQQGQRKAHAPKIGAEP
jgi:hypothetical protein